MPQKFVDYYQVLGIPRTASDDEIKRAYRRLAREHHPDLHPEAEKEMHTRKMQEVNEAYSVLASKENRAKYDQYGEHWKEGPPPPREPRGAPSGGPPGFEGFSSGEAGGFSDFFQDLFRQGRGRGAAPEDFNSSELDIEAELDLYLEEALHGVQKTFTLTATSLCPTCHGTGRSGKQICPVCGGVGEVRKPREVKARIPPGLVEGSRIRLKGQGNEGPNKQFGDLYLRIHLTPDSRYEVDGANLQMRLRLMPWQAALGSEIPLQTLDGIVRIRIPRNTHSGTRLRVAGKGLGPAASRGDLFVQVDIDLPDTLSGKAEALYRELEDEARG